MKLSSFPLFRTPTVSNPDNGCTADTVLIILGLTGSGKSTFINAAAESNRIPVGHGLESTTQSVCTVVINDPTSASKKVLLVEAPAFTYEISSIRDSERQLVKWVNSTQRKITGVLYLGKISDPRMTISPFVHLEMFEQILGKKFNTKIRLITTMWDRTPQQKAERREEELKASQWRPLLAAGARYDRFDGTSSSALHIIREMLIATSKPHRRMSTMSSAEDEPQSLRSRLLSLLKWNESSMNREPAVPDETDDRIYVAVMGLSGSGKSSFINTATRRQDRPVGHGLTPCTKEIGTVEAFFPLRCDSKIVFIDTPGWDDQYCSDPGGLKSMVQRLTTKNGKEILAGVIYLHRISSNRVCPDTFPEVVKSINGSKLCKEAIPPAFTFVTTMWDEVDDDTGLERKRILEQLHNRQILRYGSDYDSAWKAVENVMEKANVRFAKHFQSGMKELVAQLSSRESTKKVAREVEVLGQKLAEVVTDLRRPERTVDEVRRYILDYEKARSKLCTILETLQVDTGDYTISESVWRRARLEIQAENL